MYQILSDRFKWSLKTYQILSVIPHENDKQQILLKKCQSQGAINQSKTLKLSTFLTYYENSKFL